jgi:DNA-binding transcriptional LysR family regulator
MDVRQMRYLVALADELNFTRAAERCNVSQPPLSRAIRELEAELDAKLFDRDKHHVSLTPAGVSLTRDARQMLAMMAESSERARRTAAGLRGTLTIGFGGSLVYSLLPALVRNFRLEVPDVEINYRAMPVTRQIEALREGLIDVGILRLPVTDELIESRFIHREPLVVALPDQHPLLSIAGAISIGQLADARFVTYQPTRGFNYHADLKTLCRLAGFHPKIVQEVATTETVIGIVACGEGVAIVPASAERLQMRGVLFRPLESGSLPSRLASVEFALAWRRFNMLSVTSEFIERCRTIDASGDKSR